MSQDIFDLGLWDLALPPKLGHPGMSKDILDLGLWDFALPPKLGHPWLSRDVPGHLGRKGQSVAVLDYPGFC